LKGSVDILHVCISIDIFYILLLQDEASDKSETQEYKDAKTAIEEALKVIE